MDSVIPQHWKFFIYLNMSLFIDLGKSSYQAKIPSALEAENARHSLLQLPWQPQGRHRENLPPVIRTLLGRSGKRVAEGGKGCVHLTFSHIHFPEAAAGVVLTARNDRIRWR